MLRIVSEWSALHSCHSWCRTASNSTQVGTGGSLWWILRPKMSHRFFMWFRASLQAGQGIVVSASWERNEGTALDLCGWVLLSMYTARVLRGWLLKCGTMMGSRMSLQYFSPFSVTGTVTRSSLKHIPISSQKDGLEGWPGLFLWSCFQTSTLQSVSYNNILHSYDLWILHQERKFKPARVLHHIRQSWLCLSLRSGQLTGLHAQYPAALWQFLTLMTESRLWVFHWFHNAGALAKGHVL